MLKTPLCDVFGIDVPIILAPMGTCTSAEFAATVSNEGGLGGIGSLFRSATAVKRDIDVVRRLTSRPFAINHIPQALDREAFRYTLETKPAVISFALADPGDLVRQAHDVGSLVMLQVTTVAQASQAAERGVDVIIAQGGEAGGYCGEVSTMTLVPQVVDAVSPVPVVAAGGIFDGSGKREAARRDRDRLRGQIVATTQAGRQHECVLWAGQTAGGINEILSVGEIMRRLIAETEAALRRPGRDRV